MTPNPPSNDEVAIIDYVFNPFTISPVRIAYREDAGIKVEVAGASARVTGPGCEMEIPLREP